ncbi:MAG: aldo/keto reductase [Candidatus Nanopelagicaceae bacterium]|nr:aldo/keto reductase [Candidatus Nanopelagicaceae bacterium]
MSRHSELVKIERTGLEVTKLSLGTAPLGGLFTSVPEADSDGVIAAAFDADINFFDTAPLYGSGRAEVRLGRGLNAAKRPYVLSTKVGRVLNPVSGVSNAGGLAGFADADTSVEPVFDYSRAGVRRSFEDSLKRLNVDRIDVALIHDADDRIDEAIKYAYPALEEMRAEGMVSTIGVGMNYCPPTIKAVVETDIDIVLIAGRYSLLDQSSQEQLFKETMKRKVSVMIGGVYNSGILANPVAGATFHYAPAPDEIIAKAQKIRDLLATFNVSLTAAAIQFPLRHPAVTTVLTGSRSPKELLANIADFDSEVPAEAWAALEKAGLIPPID